MGWESFGVVRFDLGPLLQGQTRIAKLNNNNNNTGLLYSAFSIISSKRFTQYYPRKDS